jgi:hypothetical protein
VEFQRKDAETRRRKEGNRPLQHAQTPLLNEGHFSLLGRSASLRLGVLALKLIGQNEAEAVPFGGVYLQRRGETSIAPGLFKAIFRSDSGRHCRLCM